MTKFLKHFFKKSFVIALRFELRTYSLEGCYSIQLSYATVSDLGGVRFHNAYIKSVVLYQLSYEVY